MRIYIYSQVGVVAMPYASKQQKLCQVYIYKEFLKLLFAVSALKSLFC